MYDYNDAYTLFKWTVKITQLPPAAVNPNNYDKKVVFKNCIPFTDYIREINNM